MINLGGERGTCSGSNQGDSACRRLLFSRTLLILCGLAILATGCVVRAGNIGYIRVTEDQVELRRMDGTLTLRGPQLLDELRNLDGARVDIAGTSTGSKGLRVMGYRVLDAGDGMLPYVGELRFGQLGPVIIDEALGRRFTLAAPWPQVFRDLHGAKVWISGELVGPDLLRVVNFGIIRLPPGTADPP